MSEFVRVAVSTLGLLLSIVLLYNLKKNNRSNLYLIAYLLLINLFNLIQYFTMFSQEKNHAVIFLVHFQPLIVLTGPFLFFYVRSLLADSARLQKWDWIHFIPSVLYFINCSRYYFYSWDRKLAFAAEVIQNRSVMLSFDPVIFSGNISYIFRSLLAIGYVIACTVLVYRHYKEDFRRHIQNQLIFRWLTILIFFSYLMNIGIFYYVAKLLYFWSYDNGFTVAPMSALYIGLVSLTALNVMLFFFPNILYGLPRLDYELSSAVVLPGFSEPSFAKTKGSKDFEMSDSKLELISKKVNSYIIDKPYINPSFTVSLMSSQTGIPAHHISYYFNVYLKVDFTTWKNNLRIDYAIELINNGLADKLTLDAILRKVGFLSRSTFISAFKKRTGKTPSDYLSLE